MLEISQKIFRSLANPNFLVLFSESVADTMTGIANEVVKGDVADVLDRNVGLFINCEVSSG